MKAVVAFMLAALVGTALLAASAPAAPSKPAAAQATIVGVAAGDKRFTTLVSLVKQAGLVRTLNGKGPFTVFAPTNAAFAKLNRTAPETYAAVTSDKALLTKVLTYHVVAKRIPSTAAVKVARKGGSVKTVQGEKIALSLKGSKLFLNGSSQVIVADVKASNGVIHAINAVIVPPSIA
ncbi:MAG TPA: fasciclin domain-containing protein [Gaiellaceae bacterium]|nr:fasciclin domain-containing protein [Gaiellaceae bacterium]HET8652473.1 fasciclin domain-containing protein [Gaiellaceae bacterium]